MTNNLIATHSYAAYLKNDKDDTRRPVGIVSGSSAAEMLRNSPRPELLEFEDLTAIAYNSSLSF